METLQQAAAAGDVAALRRLLAAGADLNQPDMNGFLALHHAAQRGHVVAVQLLLAAGADPTAGGGVGVSPFLWLL
jgi:ankyrin repeat protein